MGVRKIVSGGQTGVDRAALDAAITVGIDHGGWCPQGRVAEDGIIDSRYRLMETHSSRYSVRTEQNVIDSDGTLILNIGALTGGTASTAEYADYHSRPCLVVDIGENVDIDAIGHWISGHNIQVLNVAGPRDSKSNGIYNRAYPLLEILFRTL